MDYLSSFNLLKFFYFEICSRLEKHERFWDFKSYRLRPRKHGRGTRGVAPASDAVARASDRVCVFFFFFFLRFAPTRLDSRRCGSIRAESASIRAESGWFGQNRAVSAISGRIGRRPIRPEQARNGRKRPKSALNMAVKAETCILLSFFVNQGIVCVF